mgnify:CR=1 FL=1
MTIADLFSVTNRVVTSVTVLLPWCSDRRVFYHGNRVVTAVTALLPRLTVVTTVTGYV